MENPFEIIYDKLERIETMLGNTFESIGKDEIKITSKIMTIKQVSEYLGLSKSHLYKLTSTHNIPHSKRGKRLYFDTEKINEWVLENEIWTQKDIEEQAANYLIKNKKRF